jgi:glutathione S-transferase
MALKLYVVHGSHPCATVQRALELKGIDHDIVELPPPMQVVLQRARFGGRTVPGVRFDDGEKVQGSRAILHRIEQLVPEPPLLPAGERERTVVLRAEEWGDEVLQPIARRLLWPALRRRPAALSSYGEGSQMPLPAVAVRAMAPVVTRLEMRINGAGEGAVRSDLRTLPGHLDRVDGWIADGVLGAAAPNRADLQIAPTIRLLLTIGDVLPLIEGRPAAELALRLFPRWPGSLPAGVYPPAWLPAPAAAAPAPVAGA